MLHGPLHLLILPGLDLTSTCVQFRPCIDIHKVSCANAAALPPPRLHPRPSECRGLRPFHALFAGPSETNCGIHAARPAEVGTSFLVMHSCPMPGRAAFATGWLAFCARSNLVSRHPPHSFFPACSGGEQQLQTNFESEQPSSWYAELYRRDELAGGHVIMLGADDASQAAARAALAAYPGGLQLGGGVTAENAQEYLEAGASHVIVTSYVFREGRLEEERLADLVSRQCDCLFV